MCRIIAFSENSTAGKNSIILESFRRLAHFGRVALHSKKGHKDGWGVVAYRNTRRTLYVRRCSDAFLDREYEKTISMLKDSSPDFVMGHLRKASVGAVGSENTHPFRHKNFTFCHNGTIYESDRMALSERYKKLMRGNTDSERFFFFLLQSFGKQKKHTKASMRKAIITAVRFIRKNLRYEALNFILSNGTHVWTVCEFKKKEGAEKYYTLFRGIEKKDGSWIVSSESMPIPGFKWKKMRNHELGELNLRTRAYRSFLL